jgi:DNA-binding CsgD family transcriptional regulator
MWRRHLLRRVAALTHCRIAFCVEIADAGGRIGERLLSGEDVGWDSESERCTLLSGVTAVPLSFSPLWNAFVGAMGNRRELTALQPALIDPRRWHASEMYDRFIRPTGIGEGLMSAVRLERTGTWDHWCICNNRGDPPPGPRERRLVALVHDQIAQMLERAELTNWSDRTTADLTTKRRQVLHLLLEGRSKKEIASAVGRSQPTVHEHVEHLYRHFGVNSKAKLAAYFLRRRAVPGPTRRPPLSSPQAWLTANPKSSRAFL